ncbi:MAG: ureidoglycolate lyase, partial [Candidatus Hinthialibacter sp.]
MKLLRFGEIHQEKPGILNEDGEIVDVSSFTDDFDPSFFSKNGIDTLSCWLQQNQDSLPTYPLSMRLGSPVERPGKI